MNQQSESQKVIGATYICDVLFKWYASVFKGHRKSGRFYDEEMKGVHEEELRILLG